MTASGIRVDAAGNSYIAGTTSSQKFPLVSPLVSTVPINNFGNGNAAFLSVLNPAGSALNFSTLFVGSGGSSGNGVALDANDNPIITGGTSDPDLPTTAGAFQSSPPTFNQFQQHAFVTKFSVTTPSPAVCLSTTTLFYGTIQTGTSLALNLTVTNCGTEALKVSGATSSNPIFAITQNQCVKVAPGKTCRIVVTYSPTIVGSSDSGVLEISDNGPISPQKVQMAGFSALPELSFGFFPSFGDGVIGQTSFPNLLFVQAVGFLPVQITSVTATGDFAPLNLCPTFLFPNNFCAIGATFTPTAAGPRTGTLTLFDNGVGNPHTFTLSGNGLAAYPTPGITFMTPQAVPANGGSVKVFLEGTDFFPASFVSFDGQAMPTKFVGNGLQATIGGGLLKQVKSHSVQVVNPAPGGASAALEFVVFGQTNNLGAADIIWEPFTRVFYASIPSTAAANANSLVTFDPATGIVGPPIPIGNNPGALGLSADGTTLYVGLNATNSIVPFNVTTQIVGTAIPLGSDPQKGPLTASSIQVQPGSTSNLVATLNAGFNGADGIDLIENGAVVSQFLNGPPTNVALGGTRFTDATDVFGWPGSFNPGIAHFVITNEGLLEAPGINASQGTFDTDGTNLFDSSGQVFNAATGALVGTIPNEFSVDAVLADGNSGRVFFVGGFNGLQAFDSQSLTQVGSIGNGLNVPFEQTRMQHWGPNGLSYLNFNFSTQGNDLIYLRTNMFYPSAGPNPAPAITTLNPSPVASKGGNFFLTLTGSQFVRGAVVNWNGKYRTTTWVSDTQLVADIPAADIAAPGHALISVTNPGPGGGTSAVMVLKIQ